MDNEEIEGYSGFMPLEKMMAHGRRRLCAYLVIAAVLVCVTYSAVHFTKGQSEVPLLLRGDPTVVRIRESLDLLNCMQCRPNLTLEHVVEGATDNTLDGGGYFLPQVLPIPRCPGRNAYCGDKLGDVTGFCCPNQTVTRTFEVFVVHGENNKTLHTVQCEVHESCVCMTEKCPSHETEFPLCKNLTRKKTD